MSDYNLYNNRTYIDSIIASHYVKYSRLKEIIPLAYKNSNANNLYLFIDMQSAIQVLFSNKSYKGFLSSELDISAAMLNMCAHYREYFRRIDVSTKIFIVHGWNSPSINSTLVPRYNDRLRTSYSLKRDIIENVSLNISILQELCQYIPDTYFYSFGENETSAGIKLLIDRFNLKNDTNSEILIVTKDILSFQLVPENINILRPVKREGGDLSYIIDRNNLWEIFYTEYRKTTQPEKCIDVNFISNLFAMSGLRERNMYNVIQTKTVNRYIQSALDIGFINVNQNTQSSINNALIGLGININPQLFEDRWKAINPSFQSSFVIPMNLPIYRNLSYPTKINNTRELHNIIGRYFSDIPIDLNRL